MQSMEPANPATPRSCAELILHLGHIDAEEIESQAERHLRTLYQAADLKQHNPGNVDSFRAGGSALGCARHALDDGIWHGDTQIIFHELGVCASWSAAICGQTRKRAMVNAAEKCSSSAISQTGWVGNASRAPASTLYSNANFFVDVENPGSRPPLRNLVPERWGYANIEPNVQIGTLLTDQWRPHQNGRVASG